MHEEKKRHSVIGAILDKRRSVGAEQSSIEVFFSLYRCAILALRILHHAHIDILCI
jgi:hypothetical protein